ncbi:YtcA family lipoprotein [Xanthobacter sp. TB0139]|uniref:YtcA family lipoprotein n=1 Tax=Xanthobacter sp. TB0139 TaxID=3459178 RepID=UPI0040394B02
MRSFSRLLICCGRRPSGAARVGAGLWPALFLAGCAEAPPSPSFFLYGAYFPSWMLCLTLGIIGALVMRAVFVHLGLDDQLPVRLLVYSCLAAIISFACAFFIYGL